MITRSLIALLAFTSFVHASIVVKNPNIVLSSASSTESAIVMDSDYEFWQLVPYASWLHTVGGSEFGNSSQVVPFLVDENTGPTRTGTLTIGGQTITITQAGSDYAFVPPVVIGGGPVDGSYPAGGLALTPAGDLYIPLNSGQDFSPAGMKKWTASTNTFSADLAPNGIARAGGANLNSNGDVFIAQHLAIKKFTVATSSMDDYVTGTLYPHSGGVAFDSLGNLWVTVGSPSLKLKIVAPGGGALTDILPLNALAGGIAGGIAIDALDNIYIFDGDGLGAGRVRRLAAGTTTATTIISGIGYGFASSPGLTVDGSGNVYVAEATTNSVKKWSAATGAVSTVTSSGLNHPVPLVSDGAGNLFVGNADATVSAVPRALMIAPPALVNVPLAAGSTDMPALIPSTAADQAPFAPVSDQSWLTFTNVGGVITYSWTTATSPRYAHLTVMGQTMFIQQGTPVVPTITTPTSVYPTPNSYSTSTATLGGNITSDGGAPITSCGVVYSDSAINPNPAIGGTGVTVAAAASNAVGVFTVDVSSLLPYTTYSVRAYVTTSIGTGYTTSASTFTTSRLDQSVLFFVDGPVKSTALQPDGKMLVGSVCPPSTYRALRLFDTAGNLISYPGWVDGTVNSILPLDSGKILIAGSFNTLLLNGDANYPITRNNIALLNNDGTPDTSFNPNANGIINCMALQQDGSILIGGEFTQIGSTVRNRIARFYSNGTLDLTFNPNASGPVRSIAVQTDGKIIIGGDFTLMGTTLRNRIARVSTLGVVDPAFIANADAAVNVVVVQPDGNLLVGGDFNTLNNIAHPGVARLNPNGTLDAGFAASANGRVLSIALQADGKAFIGGVFTAAAGSPRASLARVNADGTLDTSFAVNSSDIYNDPMAGPITVPATVNSLMLTENGSVMMGGSFQFVDGASLFNLSRLVNEPAMQTLAPAGSTSVGWQRGSTLPEAIDVAFDLSTDGGTTWTALGTGTRIAGGWSLSGTPILPASGTLRGRARTVCGLGNGSMGWNIVEAPFSLAAASIVVEQPVNTALTGGDTIDLGTLGLSVPVLTTFTVRNSGGFSLTGVAVAVTGANAAMFTITDAPNASIDSLDSTTFTVQAKLTSSGAKAATISIASNDANQNPFVINLIATGAASVVPVVTTTAATAVSYNTATVNGTVDAKGSLREVFFDYGLTTAYTDTAAGTPATTTTSGNVSAALTDLLPHTTYHYRARAAGDLGNASGIDKTFVTLNHAPVGHADTAIVQPGAVATIDVLANDTDTDNDNLTITAKTAVTPTTAGTVAIVANQLVFTASATFSGSATFGYTLSDGFAGTSTATVTVSTGTCTLSTAAVMPLAAAGVTYGIDITASGSWAVSESLAWASLSQTKGTGNTTVYVTLLPNATLTLRSGTIIIGGATHTVSQSGVVLPVIGPLTGTFNTIVGESFSLTIPTTGAPVTYTVTGTIPAGLTLNQATGVISGVPTTKGDYPLTVKAKNLAGSAAATLTFTLHVDPLPAGVVGTFHGYVERSSTAHFTADANLGARFEMTTTANGAVTGSVLEGVTKKPFVGGKIVASSATPNTPTFTVALTSTSLFIDIYFDATTNTATGVLRNASGINTAAITAWRNGWSAVAPIVKATSYKAQHNFEITNTDTVNGPQGYGFGSFIVTEATGALVITGKLPDGSALTCSTFVGQHGEVLLYQALHANHGSCFGKLVVTPGSSAPANNTLAGTFTWLKPASLAAAKDTVYAAGFGPLTLAVSGGTYTAPLKGMRLLGLADVADNAQLVFSAAGTDPGFTQILRIINPNNLTGTTNVATISTPKLNSTALPTLTFGTGVFSGSFIIAGTPARTAPFFGQIVTVGTTTQGYGFYLLPTVPGTGQTVTTSPKLGGTVQLQAH